MRTCSCLVQLMDKGSPSETRLGVMQLQELLTVNQKLSDLSQQLADLKLDLSQQLTDFKRKHQVTSFFFLFMIIIIFVPIPWLLPVKI